MGDGRTALYRSLLLAASFVVVASSPAFAQPADEPPLEEGEAPAEPAEPPVVKDPKVVKTWLSAGDTLIKKGDQLTKQGKTADAQTNYTNAVTAYRKAIEASEDGSVLHYQLAIALDKAGETPAALKAMQVAAEQTVKADVAKKAQTKLDELSMKIGTVALTIIPDGTQVMMGDKTIGEAPLAEPLVLMPGDYIVSLTAVGYQPKDVELKVEAGSESERKIELEPVPMVVTKPEPMEPDEPVTREEPPKPSMLPIYIGGGAAAAFLIAGTVTGIAAIGKQNQYDDSVSQTERADLRSSGKTLALVTDLCIVGAVGAAAFTTYWYMFKYRPTAKALAEREAARHHKSGARAAKVDVVPWVQPDVGGIAAVGSF